ncbi:helix-turn-helix domain-containing protein [Sphingosinicella sp. LHD-64]|uniref:helix-turn-helix domain-containing protein n=1 Tax=Sphingosinicella sp. LHD-64 TaxID=3072139 RepID=UPI00280D15F8|nr:helix-turn-helix domain-containing protein [Sphingosinicella sp. LHD-64]MDQ8758255.1 helix-turn-helix domain-containing protein [Sphingosinicella sp. LHD-64]
MSNVQVIEKPEAGAVALEPVRSRLLAELAEPASAAALAGRLGLPRQKANYHLRMLEAHGLVRAVDERRWGGLTEVLFAASTGGYLISPLALGPAAADPERQRDRLSASYLIGLAGRIIREVGGLLKRAEASGKRLATLSIDSELNFRTPADRAAFAEELARTVAGLAARYHCGATTGRAHRLVIALHPCGGDEAASARLTLEGG